MSGSFILRRITGFLWRHPYVSMLGVAFLLYLPVFLIPFSFHNDGSLVSSKGGGLFDIFDESHWIFTIGRPLYTIYLNLQAMTIYGVPDLSWWRLIYFAQMAIAMFLLWRFLEHRRVDSFWLWLMMLVLFFIPTNLLSFFWCEMEGVGAPVIFLAGLSHLLFTSSYKKMTTALNLSAKLAAIFQATVAAVLFEMALFIYPATALVVFVFTFAGVLFPFLENKKWSREDIIRDILFFGVLMVVYLVFVKTVITPFGLHHFHMTVPAGLYSLTLTSNLLTKLKLLIDTLGYSLIGSFDLLGSSTGAWITIAFLTVGLILGREKLKEFFQHIMADLTARKIFLERVAWGLLLLAIVNAPTILAGGCDHVLGYRVLLPSTMMLTMTIFKLFMSTQAKPLGPWGSPTRSLAVVLTVSLLTSSLWIEFHVVRNNHLEYARAKEQLKAVDFSRINRLIFLLNPKENKTLFGQILPAEMGLMSASQNHVAAYMTDFFKHPRSAWPLVQAADLDETLYLTPRTAIINLSIDPKKTTESLSSRDVVVLTPTATKPNNIVITTTAADLAEEKGVLLAFKTQHAENSLPFWLITEDEPFAMLQIDCLTQPKRLMQYVAIVEAKDAHGASQNVAWRLQGSHDNKSWTNLDVRNSTAPIPVKARTTYKITETTAFKHYRFLWAKTNDTKNLYIHALKLSLTNG